MTKKTFNIGGAHFKKKELYEKIDSDLEIVEMLYESVKGQIPGYLETIGEIVTSLNQNILLTPEQIEQLRFSSHSIKGSAYNLCFERLGNIAKRVEMTAREWGCPEADNSGEMLPYLYELLREEWTKVLSLMKI